MPQSKPKPPSNRIELPLVQSNSFDARMRGGKLNAANKIEILQINIGLVCNLACKHCHVESSPKRNAASDNMNRQTADRVLQWLADNPGIRVVDITGGSPEMNPNFCNLVQGVRSLGITVMDRCNPTIIVHQDPAGNEPYGWVPDFLAEHSVEVVASLPCYLPDNVRKQRGVHAFDDSVAGLKRLNDVGYGVDPGLQLNLVYNPVGASLPPPQEQLQEDYRRELLSRYGLRFNQLWTITNMPIARWRDSLQRSGQLDQYMQTLIAAFNPSSVDHLMCRHMIHIDSQGRTHDCDFNFAMGIPTASLSGSYLWDHRLEDLSGRRIATDAHCFGCTAGAGSSCGGTLTSS
ncbi:arsenosugar biosynthesis radical SAM (seleno)protein ArsS [Crateriforma spongiae]|uniref:arsenosugar biosynthesis radical SAM (seleno)protein ArsS n=1 Tax=Crateriforma spongiae TaxID=2724528 RepID=UPI00197E0235|nr:arsenosugar biosynthesis radical SAM (seleno)protein ArsS [Crateriforma spongiae]